MNSVLDIATINCQTYLEYLWQAIHFVHSKYLMLNDYHIVGLLPNNDYALITLYYIIHCEQDDLLPINWIIHFISDDCLDEVELDLSASYGWKVHRSDGLSKESMGKKNQLLIMKINCWSLACHAQMEKTVQMVPCLGACSRCRTWEHPNSRLF